MVHEGEFLQLAKDLVEPQAVRDGNVDFERFLGDAPALVGAHDAQRSEIVQTVGELDENDAHVAAHRKQHLAKAFGLRDLA